MAITLHAPTRIDLVTRTMSARDGVVYPLDRQVAANGAMYLACYGHAHPDIAYQERWLLPEPGCVVIRWTIRDGAEPLGHDWYIDVDRVDASDDTWTITDRFVDLIVHEGVGYEVLDADELAEAIDTDLIEASEAAEALRALHRLCVALARHDYSMLAVLHELAPDLPR